MATNSRPTTCASRARYPLALPTVRGGGRRRMARSTFHGGLNEVPRVRCDPTTAKGQKGHLYTEPLIQY